MQLLLGHLRNMLPIVLSSNAQISSSMSLITASRPPLGLLLSEALVGSCLCIPCCWLPRYGWVPWCPILMHQIARASCHVTVITGRWRDFGCSAMWRWEILWGSIASSSSDVGQWRCFLVFPSSKDHLGFKWLVHVSADTMAIVTGVLGALGFCVWRWCTSFIPCYRFPCPVSCACVLVGTFVSIGWPFL